MIFAIALASIACLALSGMVAFCLLEVKRENAHQRALAMQRHPAGKGRTIPMHEWSYAQYKNS